MAGAPKYLKALEELWWRSRVMRKKALGEKLSREEKKYLPPELRDRPLSPEERQSLPPQLRLPVELHGFRRPKELRGPALMKWLMLLDGIWQDRRFGDCINAFLEHGIVDPHTHEFITRQGPELDRDNEYQQTKCLEEVRARAQQCGSERRASLEIAAEWGLPGNGGNLDSVAKGLRDKLRALRKQP
jgi:hypothetical protein